MTLQKAIEEQKRINTEIFNQISCYSTDPKLDDWRAGQKRLQELLAEERKQKTLKPTASAEPKIFINGYGEATTRYITNTTYEKQQKRLAKEIEKLIG